MPNEEMTCREEILLTRAFELGQGSTRQRPSTSCFVMPHLRKSGTQMGWPRNWPRCTWTALSARIPNHQGVQSAMRTGHGPRLTLAAVSGRRSFRTMVSGLRAWPIRRSTT